VDDDLLLQIGLLLSPNDDDMALQVAEAMKGALEKSARANEESAKKAWERVAKAGAQGFSGMRDYVREEFKRAKAAADAEMSVLLKSLDAQLKERVVKTTEAERRITAEMTEAAKQRTQEQKSADSQAELLLDDKLKNERRRQTQAYFTFLEGLRTHNEQALEATRHANANVRDENRDAHRKEQIDLSGSWKARLEAQKAGSKAWIDAERARQQRELEDQRHANRNVETENRRAAAERVIDVRAAVARQTEAERNANRTQYAEARAADNRNLQAQRRADRLEYVDEQASQARRTALYKSGLRVLSSTYESGLRGIQSIVRSHLRRREDDNRAANAAELTQTRRGLQAQEAATRLGLDAQDATYSRSARRRLAAIQRSSEEETRSITAAQVRQAKAVEDTQKRLSAGVIGAASGRSAFGMGLRNLLLGVGGGIGGAYTYNVLADFQSIETTFRGIFNEVQGKAPRTTAFLKELQEFAKATPFSLRSLAEYAQKFFANGLVDPKAPNAVALLEAKLRRLADAAAATGKSEEQVQGAILGLTQISSSGRLSLEDLRQVTEGLGIRFSDVAKRLGMSTADMFDALKKGEISASDGIKAVFDAMTDIPGAMGAAARQTGNLRGAMSNLKDLLDQMIVRTLKPLGTQVAKGVSWIAEVGGKLMDGKGGWKVIRDGLTGMAIGLGALIAAKAGVEVIKLTGSAMAYLAANPAVLAVSSLVALSGVLYTLVRNSGPVKSFWDSLVKGTKDWYRVGYVLGKPIEGLSNIVKFQSSIGAVVKNIVEGFGSVKSAAKDVLSGDLEAAGRKVKAAWGDIVDAGRPGAAVARKAFESGKATALQFAYGLTGGRIGSSEIVATTAEVWGRNIAQAGVSALDYARNKVAPSIGGFFSSLFTGQKAKGLDPMAYIGLTQADIDKVNAAEAASKLAMKAREIIGSAVGAVEERAKSLWHRSFGGGGVKGGGFFGGLLDRTEDARKAVGDWLSDVALPALVDLPRVLGRGLAKVVSDDRFLKGVLVAGAAVGGAALLIGGQFVRGFVEGIWQNRGDIAGVVKDVLGFAVKSLFGSGNPFLVIGGLVVAGFAAAKVGGIVSGWIGKMKELKLNAQLAGAEFRKDVDRANQLREAQNKMRERPRGGLGFGAGLVNLAEPTRKLQAFARVSAQTVDGVTRGAAKAVTDVGVFMQRGGDAMQKGGARLTGSAAYVAVRTGEALSSIGQKAEMAGRYAQDKLTATGDRIKAGWQKVTDWFNSRGGGQSIGQRLTEMWNDPERRARVFEGGMAAVAAGVSGYFAGMADDVQTRTLGALGVISSTAAAFATGGPVVGALTAVASGVGAIWGAAARGAKEAKDRAQEYVSLLRGVKGVDERQAKVASALLDKLEAQKDKGFFTKTRADADEAAAAILGTQKQFDAYKRGLLQSNVDSFLSGNRQAWSSWRKSVATELVSLSNQVGASIATTPQEFLRQLDELKSKAPDAYRNLVANLRSSIEASNPFDFLDEQRGAFDGARSVVQLLASQDLPKVKSETEKIKGAHDEYNRAVDKTKSSWDDAKAAFQSYRDKTSGLGSSQNEGVLSAVDAAKQLKDLHDQFLNDDISANEYYRRVKEVQDQSKRDQDEVYAGLYANAKGDMSLYTSQVKAYQDEISRAIQDSLGTAKGTAADYQSQLSEPPPQEWLDHSQQVKDLKKQWEDAEVAARNYFNAVATKGQSNDPFYYGAQGYSYQPARPGWNNQPGENRMVTGKSATGAPAAKGVDFSVPAWPTQKQTSTPAPMIVPNVTIIESASPRATARATIAEAQSANFRYSMG